MHRSRQRNGLHAGLRGLPICGLVMPPPVAAGAPPAFWPTAPSAFHFPEFS